MSGDPIPNWVLWNLVPFGPREKTYDEMIAEAKALTAKLLPAIEAERKRREKIMVRAKFMLTGVKVGYNDGRELIFTAQYDETIEEDKRFAKATPTGTFTMYCDNPAANKQLELGKQYYFDISPA